MRGKEIVALLFSIVPAVAFGAVPQTAAPEPAPIGSSGCNTCQCGGSTPGHCACGGGQACKTPGAVQACSGDAASRSCCKLPAVSTLPADVDSRMVGGLVVSGVDALGGLGIKGEPTCGNGADGPTAAVQPGPRGLYTGTGFNGEYKALPRYVDPKIDGTKLAAGMPAYFASMVKSFAPNSLTPDQFDALVYQTVPPEVFAAADATIAQAKIEYEKGLADVPPKDEKAWRRFLIMSWVHSRDMSTVTAALGHPMDETGHHHVVELVPAKYAKDPNALKKSDPWYLRYVATLPDDGQLNVGFFNPNTSASAYNWGFDPEGQQNAMNAHRFSNAHNGNPDLPTDWYLRASSFVAHHVREHMLVREEPRGDWDYAETRLNIDPAVRDYGLEKAIARDVVELDKLLEAEGKITPWQLLKVPDGMKKTYTPPEANEWNRCH